MTGSRRPDDATSLSPRAAIAIGAGLIAFGGFIALSVLGLVTGTPPPHEAPPWVGACAGLVFVFGGGAMIVGYALAGGATPDGDLPPGTPLWMRVTQMTLGLGIVGALSAVASWVAFGPGPRTFTASGTFASGQTSERVGRMVFGAGAALLAVVFVALLVVSVKRLRARP